MDYHYQFYHTTAEAWEAMYEGIATAKHSIYWEVFIFVDDIVGDRFIDALIAKATAGVEVKLVLDAIGSFYFSKTAEARLRAGGVDIRWFNRLYPEWHLSKWFSRLWFRNHRKVLIVDEQTVFLGGVNIKAEYQEWDDIYLKITGKVARPLLRGFAKSYVAAGGDKKDVWRLLHPKIERWQAWKQHLRFLVHSPFGNEYRHTKKLHLRALAVAKDTVNLLTPYYSPDKQFLKAIALARKRGVKVNIFMPLRSDNKIAELIGRAYYGLTIKAGASLFFLPKMHHGKALSVDDKIGFVGSVNLTPRSFNANEESGVYFNDKKMVADLNELFNEIRQQAETFNEATYQRRSRWSRFKEWLALWFDKYV